MTYNEEIYAAGDPVLAKYVGGGPWNKGKIIELCPEKELHEWPAGRLYWIRLETGGKILRFSSELRRPPPPAPDTTQHQPEVGT